MPLNSSQMSLTGNFWDIHLELFPYREYPRALAQVDTETQAAPEFLDQTTSYLAGGEINTYVLQRTCSSLKLKELSPFFFYNSDIMAPAAENGYNTSRDSPDIEKHNMDPIVVVGFSLRFPQEATSAEGFWEMLCEGRSAMTEVPSDRFNTNGFYHPDASRTDTVGDLLFN